MGTRTIPYKCPVCDGYGEVQKRAASFASSSNTLPLETETCKGCTGSGIVWGTEEVMDPIQITYPPEPYYPFPYSPYFPYQPYYTSSSISLPPVEDSYEQIY